MLTRQSDWHCWKQLLLIDLEHGQRGGTLRISPITCEIPRNEQGSMTTCSLIIFGHSSQPRRRYRMPA